jgi:hypothetical protein
MNRVPRPPQKETQKNKEQKSGKKGSTDFNDVNGLSYEIAEKTNAENISSYVLRSSRTELRDDLRIKFQRFQIYAQHISIQEGRRWAKNKTERRLKSNSHMHILTPSTALCMVVTSSLHPY